MMNSTWHKSKEREKVKADPSIMWCECCEKPFKRWDIDMVVPEPVVFDVTKLLMDRGETVEFNFACPQCVTELCLEPLQTEQAKKFRRSNQKLREQLEPQMIN